jgi:hypothetical protein
MGPLLHPALAGTLLLAGPGSPGTPSPRALLARAVKALGGAEALARHPAATWKGQGVLHAGGAPLTYRVAGARQGPDRLAVTVRSLDTDPAYSRALVLDRTRGWLKLDDRLRALKEELAEQKERAHAAWVATLAPLAGAGFELGPAGAATVGGKSALGVRVRAKGHRDVTLYFDRDSALLLKRLSTIRDLPTGKEVKEEVRYDDYRATKAGLKHPARVRVFRDGRLVTDTEVSEYHPAEKLSDKTFAKP